MAFREFGIFPWNLPQARPPPVPLTFSHLHRPWMVLGHLPVPKPVVDVSSVVILSLAEATVIWGRMDKQEWPHQPRQYQNLGLTIPPPKVYLRKEFKFFPPELDSITCNNLYWKRIRKRIYVCMRIYTEIYIYMTEPLCCTPVNNTTL